MTSPKTENKTLAQPATYSDAAALIYLMAPGLNGRGGIPACIWGEPGTGKSTMIRALAQSLGMHVETVMLSTREPSEVCGSQIPQRGADGEVTIIYAKPKWVRNVEEKLKEGIVSCVFFDELTTCPPNTQAPALRLINEGQGPDWSIDLSTRFVCAANPPECSAGGQDLTAPMANRMGHFDAPKPDGRSFSEWLQSNGGKKHHLNYKNSADEQANGKSYFRKLQELIDSRWDEEFARACAMVGHFTANNTESLHQMPAVDSTDAGRAWSSPRTWEAATRLLATARCLNAEASTVVQVVAAVVGPASASELIAYAHSLDLPDLYDILNGKSSFEVSPSKADVAMVVMNGLANLASALNEKEKLTNKQRMNFWKFMVTGGAGNLKDTQLRVLKRVIKHGNTLFDPSIPECIECHDKLGKISQATAKNKR